MASNLSKAVIAAASTGLVLGALTSCSGAKGGGGGGGTTPAEAAAEGKACCKGMHECKGKGGCAVEGKHTCAGQNECKGQGGCNHHCPK